jgi:4-amino-4-deoxy-L-arabinose transferase-like glycosyltransferase
MTLAFWIASAGTSRIPIAGHEVYVAETALEMWERNDWIVPYCNDQPRLNKPPLNYWLTGAVAWLSASRSLNLLMKNR